MIVSENSQTNEYYIALWGELHDCNSAPLHAQWCSLPLQAHDEKSSEYLLTSACFANLFLLASSLSTSEAHERNWFFCYCGLSYNSSLESLIHAFSCLLDEGSKEITGVCIHKSDYITAFSHLHMRADYIQLLYSIIDLLKISFHPFHLLQAYCLFLLHPPQLIPMTKMQFHTHSQQI